MNGSCARPRVSTKNPPSGSPAAAAPERPAGAGLAGLRLKRKRHALQRNDKQNRSVDPNNPLPLGFIAGEKEKKKTKTNQNPGTELLFLGPSSFGHLQSREPPPCPGPGSESHKSHSSSRTHSLGIPHRILTTGEPSLQHICTTSSVSGVPSLSFHRAIFNDESY